MDISAVGDVPVGISLYNPQRIAPTVVELVRGTCGDESPVAGLLEGVEVPVGVLNVGTIDLVTQMRKQPDRDARAQGRFQRTINARSRCLNLIEQFRLVLLRSG